MAQSYRHITPRLARQIRLIMSDVDGTLTPGGDVTSTAVVEAIHRLEQNRIIVGLVSGRTLPMLESLSYDLGISGPIIAENGGVARMRANGELVDLGYSRKPALEILNKLKRLFPGATKEREDNKERMVDIVFRLQGIEIEELNKHLENTQLLDSGYILHLMQKGISKGVTLMRLLKDTGDLNLSLAEVLVFGDSTTDLSLFELFPNSVLIANPGLPPEQRQVIQKAARYASDMPYGEGFAEVALHILKVAAINNQ